MIILLPIFIICVIVGVACNIRAERVQRVQRIQAIPCTRDPDADALHEINLAERREILDNAIGKYDALLNVLEKAINSETDPKKRATLLSKQITTLEKLNRTLEKREKLDL